MADVGDEPSNKGFSNLGVLGVEPIVATDGTILGVLISCDVERDC